MSRDIPPMQALTISVVCFALFLICMGLIFGGCASSTLGKSLNVGVIASAGADLYTTRAAINSGRGVEGNPIMGQSLWQQLTLKSAGVSTVLAAAWVADRQQRQMLAHILRGAFITLNAVVAARNYQIARGR